MDNFPKRIVAPLWRMPRCSGMKSMTGWRQLGANHGIRILESTNTARILDHRNLQSQTQSKVRNVIQSCIMRSGQLAFKPARPESSGTNIPLQPARSSEADCFSKSSASIHRNSTAHHEIPGVDKCLNN